MAIVRALALNSDVLVLDEPTASLPESETARLFEVLQRLRARGVAIIYVTHRLDEVFRLADMVTVLRDGRKIRTCPVGATTPPSWSTPSSADRPRKCSCRPQESQAASVIRVDNLQVGRVGPVSFEVKAGEIVGLAGLRGAGQNAIGRAPSRASSESTGGHVTLKGQPLKLSGRVADAMAAGIRFVTSNRESEGLALPLTVTENLFLNPGALGRRVWAAERPSSERQPRGRGHSEVLDCAPTTRRASSPRSAAAISRRCCWRAGSARALGCSCWRSLRWASTSAPRPRSTRC